MDDIELHFTAQRLDLIVNALAQRPWHEVAQVLDDIRNQVARQQVPPQPRPNGHSQEGAPQ